MGYTTWTVHITPQALTVIDTINAKLGMPKKDIVQRVMEWLASQPETVQQAVLGTLPDDTGVDAARIALEQMGTKRTAGFVGKKAAHPRPGKKGTPAED